MRTLLFAVLAAGAVAADSSALVEQMMDASLNVAQRNNACYQLRGVSTPEVNSAMRRALGDPVIRACAGINLRKAGAIEALKDALGDEDFEVRALAARELGGFEKLEFLPLLAAAARDPQLLVGINAVEGLANYRDPAVLPYLLDLAKDGGLVGTSALGRAQMFRDPRVLATGRRLLDARDVSDRLAAMRVIAELGDSTDIPKLREIQKKETSEVTSSGRGFGLMPVISLSRAAQTTIEQIEKR
jgi:HEAT repeat protein